MRKYLVMESKENEKYYYFVWESDKTLPNSENYTILKSCKTKKEAVAKAKLLNAFATIYKVNMFDLSEDYCKN